MCVWHRQMIDEASLAQLRLLSTVYCRLSILCCLLFAVCLWANCSLVFLSLFPSLACVLPVKKRKNEATQFKTWLSMRTNSFMIVPTSLQLLFWFHFCCYSIGTRKRNEAPSEKGLLYSRSTITTGCRQWKNRRPKIIFKKKRWWWSHWNDLAINVVAESISTSPCC